MTRLRHFAEAAVLMLMLTVFRVLPLDAASALGGAVGRMIGPRLAASRKADKNIIMALPELDSDQRRAVITGMWDNLGRIMAEYPHLEHIGRTRVQLECDPAARDLLTAGRPCLLIGGHLANWEIAAATMLAQFGHALDLTYRAPNNPYADRLLLRARSLGGKVRCHPKSRSGGQDIIRAMHEGRYIAILIDQKYNEGIAIPFFGIPAMTNPAFAVLGRKLNYPVIPARIERTGGAHFKVTIHAPLNNEGSVEDTIAQAHRHLENWIAGRPAQWLWLHRRWDSQKLRAQDDTTPVNIEETEQAHEQQA